MDRNAIIGILLIGLILLGSSYFFSPETPAEAPADKRVEQVESLPDTTAAATDTAALRAALPQAFANAATGQARDITLENDSLRLTFSTKGGRLVQAELKGFRTYDQQPLILFNKESATYSYQFSTGNQSVRTEDLFFEPTVDAGSDNHASRIVFTANLGGGGSIKQIYALPKRGFMVEHRLELSGLNTIIPRREQYIELDWKAKTIHHERDDNIASQNTTVWYSQIDESPDYLSETSDDEEKFKAPTKWVSFKEQFFCQAIIAETPFVHTDISSSLLPNSTYIKQLSANLTLPYTHQNQEVYDMRMYLGPLHYQTLRRHDLGLERQIPLGWSFFLTSWVNRFMIIPLFNLLNNFIGNYGIIILILTIFIKLLVLPLTYRSYISTAKMRLLKPEIDALKAKHNNDMTKVQMEQMTLMRSAGVSPLGGCLPMLLQIPILFAMFRFFPASIELRQEGFLWADDLSTYDSILNLPFTIPFYGSHVSLFTLLMTASTILYTWMNNKNSPQQQKEFVYMSYIMPFFLLGFLNSYAAGLSLYYFLFNVLTILQQWLFKQFVDDNKLRAQLQANMKKPKNTKKTGLAKRLEEMAKQQQQMRKR